MRTVHDPYGGVNPLIDKMIGNAYDIVKYVARYLKEIRYLAENMSTVYQAVHGDKITLEGTGDGSSSLSIPLPDDLDPNSIINATAVAGDGSHLFFPGSGAFYLAVNLNDSTVEINIENPDLEASGFTVTLTVSTPS